MDEGDVGGGVWNTHNGILLGHIKEWNILPFAATFMDLEMIILNKVSKTKKNIFLICEM